MKKTILSLAVVAALVAPAIAQPPAGFTPPTPEEQAAAFDKADANKDASLDAAEFKVSMGERAAQMPEDRLKASFDRRDADKNGKISKAEYTAPRAPGGPGGGGRPPGG